MNPEVAQAFSEVANQFMVPDDTCPGDEWECRLCSGKTIVGGPVIHAPECALTVLHEALEAQS